MYWTVIQLEYTILSICLTQFGKLDFVVTIVDIDARRGTSAWQRRVSARQYRVSAASMRGSAAATQPPGEVPRQSAAHDLTHSTSLLWPVFELIQGWLTPVDYVDRYLMDHTDVSREVEYGKLP
ncbi:hypothetical protein DFH09DRAFT_1100209 [Mycena vulgaris]|nr:hypothetical protein DFH09DRAFT_1100209 [Mycena vulgaris]